jgi:N-acyl-D-aspartate/D-glutamate deacylase
MLDVLIRGGIIVDGTGSEPRHGDLGIVDGRLVTPDAGTDQARRVIEADGRVVAPGFIDIHTHVDAQAFWDPQLSPSPLHGVTTMFAGNCGFTIAPLTADAGPYLMKMLARVEGMPLDALANGVPWGDWASTSEYFGCLDRGFAANVGFMVGHSTLRRVVMGPDANERAATQPEIDAMCGLLRLGLTAGGVGFSSTWSKTHNDAVGRPVPSRLATEAELLALAAVCADFEGTSLEFLPKTSAALPFESEDVELFTAMSRAAQSPVNWNLMRVEADSLPVVQNKLEAGTFADQNGGRIVGLLMPEPLVLRMTFYTGFVLDSIQGWKDVVSLPRDERQAALRDPSVRERLRADARADATRAKFTNWETHEIVEVVDPSLKRYEGRQVGEIARAEGKDAFDALLDIVVADQLRTSFINVDMDEPHELWERRAEVASDPRVVVGGSDAGAHLDMHASQGYCTTMIENMVRTHRVMPLQEAVRLLTTVPAGLYGVRDRGVISDGAVADIVIFDEDTVGGAPARTRADLPGGASRLYAEAHGVDHVLVGGVQVVENGEYTGELPGRVLKSGVDTKNPSLRIPS